MLELNKDRKKPLYFRIIWIILILFSSIMMFIYLSSAVYYITSGPRVTLIEDTTIPFLIQITLLGFSLFFLILAWFRHITNGIVSSVFTCAFLVYTYIAIDSIQLGIMPWLLLGCALCFILLGLISRYRRRHMADIMTRPIKDEFNGPDVYKFGMK